MNRQTSKLCVILQLLSLLLLTACSPGPKTTVLTTSDLDATTADMAAKLAHEMDATFRSATRSKGKDRTEAYLVEYRITTLATGELVWDESFEFKRVATGLSYD